MSDITIKNALILTQNSRREVFEKDVRIEGNRIAEVGKNLSKSGYVIDAKGKLLIPGLVNTHCHAYMAMLRGYAEDMEVEKWLSEKVWPIEAIMVKDKKAGKLGTHLSCLEMIRSGVTAFADMTMYSDSTVPSAVKEVGMRGFLGYGMADLGNKQRIESELKGTEKFISAIKEQKTDRIKPVISPHSVYTCSEETLKKTIELSEKYKAPMQIHCAETRKEVYDCKKRTGKRPLDYLKSIGMLKPETILAHCVWLTKAEINTLAGAGASVSYNPTSNLKLASGGLSPVPEMLEAGVNVSLGTDGPASNNSLNIFFEMKIGSLVQKNFRWNPEVMPAQSMFDMATLNGGMAFGYKNSIEKGNPADLVLLERGPGMTPLYDPMLSLVYSKQYVQTTIIDGEIVMENMEIKTLNEQKLLAEAQEVGMRLVAQKTKKMRDIK
ncbi:MAG: amidohydrolase [archaeon]